MLVKFCAIPALDVWEVQMRVRLLGAALRVSLPFSRIDKPRWRILDLPQVQLATLSLGISVRDDFQNGHLQARFFYMPALQSPFTSG
jgi:hypothetical protein